MNENEARDRIGDGHGQAALTSLDVFYDLLLDGNSQQNLIASSTLSEIWSRHFLDSAQLIMHAPARWGRWIDIGSGAGLPGMVVALLTGGPVTMIEPRRLRVQFLEHCRTKLSLDNITVIQARAETASLAEAADVISARAVAKLEVLLAATVGFADRSTTYIFPKGESAKSEVAAAKRSWQGEFHVKPSIVDPKSGIIVATNVARR